jgi:hypothetical protein
MRRIKTHLPRSLSIRLNASAVAFPRTPQRLVEAWAEIHHVELLGDWALLQSGRSPLKIEPLH